MDDVIKDLIERLDSMGFELDEPDYDDEYDYLPEVTE